MIETSNAPALSLPVNRDALISMRHIKKVFVTDEVETHALVEVHLDVKKGEYVAISGPSGCGKTTLLSILGLLDTPSGGEYTLAGEAGGHPGPLGPGRGGNRENGLFFQGFKPNGGLTGVEKLALPLDPSG